MWKEAPVTDAGKTPPAVGKKPDAWTPVVAYPLGTIGALLGAAVGVWIMKLGADSNLYVEAVIGVLAGLGAGLLGRHGGWPMGVIAGVITLVVGVWAQWKIIGPLPGDPSFAYFALHVTQLAPITLLVHAVGVGAAVWVGARK